MKFKANALPLGFFGLKNFAAPRPNLSMIFAKSPQKHRVKKFGGKRSEKAIGHQAKIRDSSKLKLCLGAI
jgi:hypothetical protein